MVMNIGGRIKQLREAKGLKQTDVYTTIGLSSSYYSEIEDGKKNCTIETLKRICESLHMSLSDFFKDEIEEINNPPLDIEKAEILKNSKVSTEELKQALKIIEALKDK